MKKIFNFLVLVSSMMPLFTMCMKELVKQSNDPRPKRLEHFKPYNEIVDTLNSQYTLCTSLQSMKQQYPDADIDPDGTEQKRLGFNLDRLVEQSAKVLHRCYYHSPHDYRSPSFQDYKEFCDYVILKQAMPSMLKAMSEYGVDQQIWTKAQESTKKGFWLLLKEANEMFESCPERRVLQEEANEMSATAVKK
jgi:hypothetical protein